MRAPTHRPPPLISDDAALALINAQLDQRHLAHLNTVTAADRNMTVQQRRTQQEADAVAAALEQKDFRPLAALVRGGQPLQTSAARQLAADRLAGAAIPPGRPRLRYSITRPKNYLAACELPDVLAVLREHYPSVRVTREWAIVLLARRWNLDEESFRNFMRSRHRP
jgi:hypothetical protein